MLDHIKGLVKENNGEGTVLEEEDEEDILLVGGINSLCNGKKVWKGKFLAS